MRWRGRRQSDNVEDQRGRGGGGIGFPAAVGRMRIPIGGSAGGGAFRHRHSGRAVLCAEGVRHRPDSDAGRRRRAARGGGQITQDESVGPEATDEMKQFMATVLAETEDAWNGIFQAEGETYSSRRWCCSPARCGQPAVLPARRPGRSIARMTRSSISTQRSSTSLSGNSARRAILPQAYVVAHEVGHHVQNLIGVLPKFNQARQQMSEAEANQMSIRVELQADCFAGVWGHYTAQKGMLEQGDVEEALNAAQKIGDDNIQKRTQGYVVPESFNHGTSQQRQTWLARGLKSGKLADCDTFNNPV